MSPHRLLYFVKRLWHIGFFTASKLLYYRLKKIYFKYHWQDKKKNFMPIPAPLEAPLTVTILGFGSHTFSSTAAIDWHNDFFTTDSPANWTTHFFADITIPSNQHLDLAAARVADIKVPWELSRLHCLHGQSVETVLAILSSWMTNNPFPFGVNWFNPMEVSIRAINIIIALKHHTGSPELSATVMAQIQELLAYHASFIEHCWEVSDKPNNHYLADLVGYLHLCCFLDITKYYRKRYQAWEWIQKAFKQQLLPDGTSYEGSTAYHSLITELFDLALVCAKEHKLPFEEELYQIQEKMHAFIAACTDKAGNLVLIGDNDSGVICPLSSQQPKHSSLIKSNPISTQIEIKHFPHFGLTIQKNNRCMLTLRHAASTPKQPTGHFHRDEHAITLSIDGIPVFIDPGTYVYTAHPAWRNAFRAASMHTTVVPAAHTTVPSNLDLFQLPKIACGKTTIYRHCQMSTNEIVITDTVNSIQAMNWYWHLGPSVQIEMINAHQWLLLYKQHPLAEIQHSLPLHLETARASTTYGSYSTTLILSGSAQAQKSNKMLQQCRIVLMR